MKYIKAEEFLKQPKEVQKVFENWWQPNVGDLYCNIYNNQQENVLVINKCQLDFSKSFKDDIKQFGCILFTEGQLRQFIENKTGYKATLVHPSSSPIEIWLYTDKGIKRISSIDKFDVLQAYWKVALEIAKGEVK